MRSLVLVMLLLVLPGLPAIVAAEEESGASHRLWELFEDEWQHRLAEFPTFATRVGEHLYNDRLPVPSVGANEARKNAATKFLARLREIDREALSKPDRIHYDIFERLIADEIAEYEFRSYLLPVTNRSGFHVAFARLPEQMPFQTLSDYENYIARLQRFDGYARDHIKLMRHALAEGFVLPGIVLEGAEGIIEPHIVEEVVDSRFFRPFESFPETIPEGERERIMEEGATAIRASVVPGYRVFLEFLRDEYIPACRTTIAASDLPDGRAFYEHRVRRFTTFGVTPGEIHETGLAEVKRLRGEMQEVIDEVGFEGSFEEFIHFLRTDPRFYVDEPDQLMQAVALVLKRMDGVLPQLFKTLPRMPYGIKPVPDYIAPKTTTAYYERPSGDGTRAGYYFVNTYDLASRPLYEVEALSLHEAVPGHHLQIALQQELEGMPKFRRFSGFTAFVEGWALYAERLGLETGFYEDPYSNFGRLTYEMWRACRLVVDTGIHYFDWSRQDAIDFMAANSALTLHNVTTEVDRYISWPGQALAYKTGEMKIRALRRMCEEALGSQFDVRLFHDVVLGSGAVPLDVLDANVRDWLDVQLEAE